MRTRPQGPLRGDSWGLSLLARPAGYLPLVDETHSLLIRSKKVMPEFGSGSRILPTYTSADIILGCVKITFCGHPGWPPTADSPLVTSPVDAWLGGGAPLASFREREGRLAHSEQVGTCLKLDSATV